ncbi:MAG TPA: OmpA family protein [Polyangiaceae bacterium]|nr:OmpA family protein [Polyangiaceae bacterium]
MSNARMLIGIAALSLASCVSQGKYDAAVADANAAKQRAEQERTRGQEKDAKIAQLNAALSALQQAQAVRDERLAKLTTDGEQLHKELDDATALNQSLRDELTKLGKNADKLLAERASVASALEQTKARLEELRKAQAKAEARAALYREVALKFKKMVDAGALAVSLREGRMVLVLANDVLFDSGKTELKPAGRATLDQVAEVLTSLRMRRYQIAGHTDNQPIHVSPFDSNWELSAARGLVVLQYLIKKGMPPSALSAAGYGEYDPVAANTSTEGMAKNRRIEIVLQPNIDEIVSVPGVAESP